MKATQLIPLIGLIVSSSALAAEAPPAQTTQTASPQTHAQWLERMTDFTRNGSAYRDPKVFVPWVNAVTEPGFYTQMGGNMMEPGNWYPMMNSMMDPRSMNNYMQFADPAMYMKWMTASMDPNFYTAIMSQVADPGKMMRWVMMPMDPNTMNMMMQSMNPAMYTKWAMAPMDPRAMQMMMAPANPALYGSWMNTTMNPQTYGAMGNMANMANPAAYQAPAANTAGAPAFNFFDPNAWMNMAPTAAGSPPTVRSPHTPAPAAAGPTP